MSAPASPWDRPVRLARRIVPSGLTARFLIMSVVVTGLAMLLLGEAVSYYVRSSITRGVAETAAASLDSLVTNSIADMVAGRALTEGDKRRLDDLFDIASDAQTTPLVEIRIFHLDGTLLYEVSDAVVDTVSDVQLQAAIAGTTSSDLVDLPLQVAGPLGSHTISLLRLYSPLLRPGTEDVFAVAGLYYSAKALLALQARAQFAVWTIVLIGGGLVIAGLYAFVASTDRTIRRQNGELSANLDESRRLSDENRSLHLTSEQLRIDAIEANEQLLARVGSDIHDGPLQLLTLAILQPQQSPDAVDAPRSNGAVELTAEAIAELRSISSGLVLPELAGLTLAETLKLAIERYEGATGTLVHAAMDAVDHVVEPDVQVCLYRIVQESLSNAYRHSGGFEQSVNAWGRDGEIDVIISNARRGGPLPADDPLRPKLGLRGMHLRVEAVGGSLVVEMSDAQVVVKAKVPDRKARPGP